uniref:Uncharacterized protein n=1 Tax=Populus trichocarpa TaxID=3694 RepID=A0A2K1RA32_POPTR
MDKASFDRYLEDKPRVFKAIFPDKRRSQQLNEVFIIFSVRFPLVSLYTSQTATCPSLQEMVREEIASHGNVR